MRFPDGDEVVGFAFGISALALIFGVLGLVGWATYGSIKSNGETDYCYVEMWSPGQMAPQYQLHAHRPWRVDRMIGNFGSLEEATSKATAINCPMGKR